MNELIYAELTRVQQERFYEIKNDLFLWADMPSLSKEESVKRSFALDIINYIFDGDSDNPVFEEMFMEIE